MSKQPICPMMGVTLRDPSNGYSTFVNWHPEPCHRGGCALWTDYGCGLSHNITKDYQSLLYPKPEEGEAS